MFFIRRIRFFILIVFLGGAVFIWSAVFEQVSDNILEVTFFDIGQGDAIFIETPAGKQILIDGGPDKSILEKLGQEMPLYDRTIDLVILTHPDADHLTGLVKVLNYYKIDHILTSGLEKDTVVYQKWKELIEQNQIPLTLAQAGQNIILEEGIIFEVFWPEQSLLDSYSDPTNNVSVVGRLVYGKTEILLTGDIEKKVENILLDQNIESDILKLAHHGSKTSTGDNFLKIVNPGAVVISVGENNRYNHPSPEVLERIKDILTYRTDQNGDIKILTDGILFDILTEL
ncbi:MBL fold metallo-hydrolase [Patescibacteria group bacterium]|nr:MBL fold metallo-hydrolase [Patescibacteria group bacterium]MBU1563686.1 MBL fold metallo-hydrolase [Patescibacteria group bacterium]